jgi:hypothetical protein
MSQKYILKREDVDTFAEALLNAKQYPSSLELRQD